MGQRMAFAAILVALAVTFCAAVYGVRQGGFSNGLADPENTSGQQQDQKTEKSGFAILELFTSEGCSSCPPADRNLIRIANLAKKNGKAIYTLSYHVDYWNYLGWKDPYSDRKFTDRQRQYAKQFRSESIYTPQMVVNGRAEFNGGNQSLSDRAIKIAMDIQSTAKISIQSTVAAKGVRVDWNISDHKKNDVVHIALVQNRGTQKVTRGENARRELSHVNIVRDLKSIAKPDRKGQVRFSLPQGLKADELHVVAFIQSTDDQIIRAAAKSSIVKRQASKTAPSSKNK